MIYFLCIYILFIKISFFNISLYYIVKINDYFESNISILLIHYGYMYIYNPLHNMYISHIYISS